MAEWLTLIERLEKLTEPDRETDRECAIALGWHERRVSRLGLSGRSPGSWRWFIYPDDTNGKGRAYPPRFSGSRKKAETIALLRARSEGGNKP